MEHSSLNYAAELWFAENGPNEQVTEQLGQCAKILNDGTDTPEDPSQPPWSLLNIVNSQLLNGSVAQAREAIEVLEEFCKHPLDAWSDLADSTQLTDAARLLRNFREDAYLAGHDEHADKQAGHSVEIPGIGTHVDVLNRQWQAAAEIMGPDSDLSKYCTLAGNPSPYARRVRTWMAMSVTLADPLERVHKTYKDATEAMSELLKIDAKESNRSVDTKADAARKAVKALRTALSQTIERLKTETPRVSGQDALDAVLAQTRREQVPAPKPVNGNPALEQAEKVSEELRVVESLLARQI